MPVRLTLEHDASVGALPDTPELRDADPAMPLTARDIPADRQAQPNAFHAYAMGHAADVEVRLWSSTAADSGTYAVATAPASRHFARTMRFDTHAIVEIALGDCPDATLEIDGRTIHEGPLAAGSVAIVPAGAAWGMRWQGRHDFLNLRLPTATLALLGPAAPATAPAFAPQRPVKDPFLAAVGAEFRAESDAMGVVDCTYLYSLATTAVLHLMRRYAGLRPGDCERPVRRLGRREASALARFIEDRLGGSLPLTVLAAETGLSPHHFARVFRETFGAPPHTYILHRRIARALDLLRAPDAPSITDIALATGFSTPSHFAAAFRKVTGKAPRDARANLPQA